MAENYISRKDRIIASAIEIISDSGISALTTKNLAAKENMSEALIYKYFGSIDEVLVEVVEFYFKYDNMVRKSSLSKEGGYIDKLRYYLETYAEYYGILPILSHASHWQRYNMGFRQEGWQYTGVFGCRS